MTILNNFQASLAEEVRAIVAASDATSLASIDHAIDAGHKLASAKADCEHGSWLPFLERAGVPERKAQRLIALARTGFKSDLVSDLGGIASALRFASTVHRVGGLFADISADLQQNGEHDIPTLERTVERNGLALSLLGEIIAEHGDGRSHKTQ